MALAIVFFVVYALDIFFLFLYGLNLYYMIIKSSKGFRDSPQKADEAAESEPELSAYPFVTVQLPIFNERYVAERIIRAAASIRYPKDRFEIQVLDDSTDSTLEISRRTVSLLQSEGFSVSLLHRTKRTGQKGSALREALVTARGEYIAVFDADFIPAENILTDTLGYFADNPDLGIIQTRWGHLNTKYSSLTRAQSLAIDGHFIVEQVARSAGNLFLNFNGTAGIWRRNCILDAGNWQDDTLTEDLDLSYRAQLKGWRIRYLHTVCNPSELPAQINAYKSQQFRWAKGSIQTALKLGGEILRSPFSLWKKIQGILHVTYYTVHPLLLINILLTIPLTFVIRSLPAEQILPFGTLASVFGVATFAPPIFCAYSQFRLYKDWKRRLLWLPLTVFLGTGVAVNNTRGFLEAIFQKKSEFIRTPKFGIMERKDTWKQKDYRTRFSSFSVPEALVLLYLLGGIVFTLKTGNFYLLPYMIYYCCSFSYVFILSFLHGRPKLRARRFMQTAQ